MRGLVPVEVAAVVALALVPLPEMLPVALPLIVVATLARLVRGRSWGELVRPGGALVGALAGAAALGIAVLAGTPLVEQALDRAVEWTTFPMVRGNFMQLVTVAMLVAAMSAAMELALRGWIVERVLELARGPGVTVLAVLVGAFAEAVITRGDLTARVGAGIFGAGLGWMYVASGRNVVAPLCARMAFQLGALVLEWLRVIG